MIVRTGLLFREGRTKGVGKLLALAALSRTGLAQMGQSDMACESLLTTPVPLSYSRHTSRFLTIWCGIGRRSRGRPTQTLQRKLNH